MDGRAIAIADQKHHVVIWTWQEGDSETLIHMPEWGDVYVMAFSTDSSVLIVVTALSDTEAVLTARFSPNGTFIFTGSRDGTAAIWETATGHQLASIVHEHEVYAVAWSEDERAVVTACRNQHIRLWLWQPEDLIALATTRLTRNLTYEEWSRYIGNESYRKTFTNLGWREREPEEIE